MEKYIVSAIILVIILAIVFLTKFLKKNQEKRLAQEKKATLEKRAVSIFYESLSVNKKTLPDEEFSQVALFELIWSEKDLHAYNVIKGVPTKRTAEEILIAFLKHKKELKGIIKSEVSLKEIDAFSSLFIRKITAEYKENNKNKDISWVWWELILEIYKRDFDVVYDEKDFVLYEEFIFSDIKEHWDFSSFIGNVMRIHQPEIVKWCIKLEADTRYKNLKAENKRLNDERKYNIFLKKLEGYQNRNIIDKDFLYFMRFYSDEREQIIVRKVFDEIILNEVMEKLFPGKQITEINPEILAIVTQSYAIKILNLIE